MTGNGSEVGLKTEANHYLSQTLCFNLVSLTTLARGCTRYESVFVAFL